MNGRTVEYADWPELVRPLIRRYGASMVWSEGMAELQFPPTWIVHGTHYLKLKDRLEKRS